MASFVNFFNEINPETIYDNFRAIGFIYGTSIKTLIPKKNQNLNWTEAEKTKINLFDALAITYYDSIENASQEDCIVAIISFYNTLNTQKRSVDLSQKNVALYEILEKIIDTRIQTNESAFKKNFSHILTNALLFVDVLAFEYFLIYDKDPQEYAAKLEETLTNTVFLALNSKEDNGEYESLLVKLFSSSVRYTTISSNEEARFDLLDLEEYEDLLEQRYILDLTCLAIWNDRKLDQTEYHFVNALGTELKLDPKIINTSVNHVYDFIAQHESDISFFNYSNPINHFYKQTTRTVSVLILRNKNRLLNELSQSKELAILLGQSTYRDLTKEEKLLVKKQLLDICKTIPSLAIFILPGGSILMPILIKFIPQLLPSAFNENKI